MCDIQVRTGKSNKSRKTSVISEGKGIGNIATVPSQLNLRKGVEL